MTRLIRADILESYHSVYRPLKSRAHLHIITATKDKAVARYVKNKIDMGSKMGVKVTHTHFEEDVTHLDIEKAIEESNNDNSVHGIILQLPLYGHLDSHYLTNLIVPGKDVDGLTDKSIANLENKKHGFVPCTPRGVIALLKTSGYELEELVGKNVVIIGRGPTAGSPMAVLFKHLNSNVVLLHSKTKKEDLEFYVRHADVVISCVGKRGLLKTEWFKEDSVLIGVGFSYDEFGKQHLDFEVSEVLEHGKVRMVTDRVNSTGKATVISLLLNTIEAARGSI